MKKIFIALMLCFVIGGCDSNEILNEKRRVDRIDYNSSLIGYVTCLNRTGQVVFSGVIKGKVTRAGSDNAGAYVFWFDNRGRYHQWNGEYFYTDYPLNLVVDPILIEIEGGEK